MRVHSSVYRDEIIAKTQSTENFSIWALTRSAKLTLFYSRIARLRVTIGICRSI